MPIHYVTGDNESLVASAVIELVASLVGSGDRSLMVDEFDGEDYEVRSVIDAAQTSPFLTDRRVVVARGVGRFDAEAGGALAAYIDNPLPTTDLVLVAGGGRVAKALTDALKRNAAHIIDPSPPTRAADKAGWFAEQIQHAGLKLDANAQRALAAWLGEDVGRLHGILDTLISTYGTGSGTLRIDDVSPFFGDGGGVPPWDLTDAIDRGDTSTALQLLHRMMGRGERHPLQVMAILHGHYHKLLSIDGLNVRDEAAAAAAMGIKPGYPAKKALEQYRRLGSSSVQRAMSLLGQADLDLRGAKEWEPELVMEIVVARLSKLSRQR